MASLRSYGSHSSLPQATSNLPSIAQAASSVHHSLDGVSVSNTFGIDNDTESQRVIRARMTLREDIGKLRDESTLRFDTIETDIESIKLTLDKHNERFTSIETDVKDIRVTLGEQGKTLADHSAQFTSINKRLASIENTSRSQHDGLQNQLSDLNFLVNVMALTLGIPLPLDKSQFPQILANLSKTQLTAQPSTLFPPLEPIQFSRIRAPSDSPSPGPSTRRLPNAERVDFPVNPSEVDVHQLLSEARADTGPETKHAVKGLLQNLKTVIRSVSSKSLKSSKSVKSFKTTN
ncbi:hypothetical protein HETIRDRAFT_118266 [Heterobasidion irregulare TC 32-1]|uniref:Uncharacterized protein n=1 Tax=Heterobasidion irregulare (strain TC 32-1) TaxID=747525 RepID=W4K5G3_HETIT|nr:uncharacterized protein HETIRDRAFT_118266 [Heterobasidion irregulare TC 32-1]ETW80271.1 hypothetical protein HETIRDRAFT_118266 [Heterobasidion irregulare TC 32-1]